MAIILDPMNEREFKAFKRETIPVYGDHMFKAGEYPTEEAAMEAARKEITNTYTREDKYPNYPFHIFDDKIRQRVGMLEYLLIPRGPSYIGFLNYIGVYDKYQRRGYAKNAIQQMETMLRAMRIPIAELNVLNYKDGAKKLYEGLGYTVKRKWVGGEADHPTRVDMHKRLF